MKNKGAVILKIQIPKKLYNKIKYFLNKYGNGISRDYFFDSGVDQLTLKNRDCYDIPDPQNLFRFSDEEEANLVTWQVRFNEQDGVGYKKFMEWYGYSGRDILASALYYYTER